MNSEVMDEVVEEGIDLEEIAKKYEEKGFFRRLGDMFSGLGQPRDTREYKLARIELQRLAAPLCAVVVVSLFAVTLAVVTAVKATCVDVGPFISEVQLDTGIVEPLEDPPVTDIDMTTDINIEIAVSVYTDFNIRIICISTVAVFKMIG